MTRIRSKWIPAAALFALVASLNGRAAEDFPGVLRQNFTRWDLNHDGILSSNEVDAAAADPQTMNADAAAVAALKRASRVTKTPLPPFTLENVPALATEHDPDLTLMFREGRKRIAGATNRVLFAENLPKLETIHQGELGNCFCLAPLGAMVHHDPAQVAEMFSRLTNGDYCVRLGSQTVEIAPPTDAEIAMTSSNEHDGIWVNVYEKAVGTARNRARPEAERVSLPLDALAHGGSAGTMLAFITGHDIVRFSFKFAKAASVPPDFNSRLAELRERLSAATAARIMMTCGTLRVTTPGLRPNHAYAVLDYNATADTVTLWDPHGDNFSPAGAPGPDDGYARTNGILQIPVTEFVRQYSGMAFEVVAAKSPNT